VRATPGPRLPDSVPRRLEHRSTRGRTWPPDGVLRPSQVVENGDTGVVVNLGRTFDNRFAVRYAQAPPGAWWAPGPVTGAVRWWALPAVAVVLVLGAVAGAVAPGFAAGVLVGGVGLVGGLAVGVLAQAGFPGLGVPVWMACWDGVRPPVRTWMPWPAGGWAGLLVGAGWAVTPLWVPVGVLLVGVGWALVAHRVVRATSEAADARRAIRLEVTPDTDPVRRRLERVRSRWEQLARPPERGEGKAPTPLVRSKLVEAWALTDGGWEGTVRLPDDTKATWETVRDEGSRIGKAFRVPRAQVHVEQYRGGQGGESHVSIAVHRTDALAGVMEWDPTVNKHSRYLVAIAANGRPIYANLYRGDTGVEHGVVAGVTGAGKSSGMEPRIGAAAMDPAVHTIVADAKGGLSLPRANAWADRLMPSMGDDLGPVIRTWAGLAAIVAAREQAQQGNRRPTPDWPAVLAFFPEAMDVLAEHLDRKAIVRQWVQPVLRKGRAVCVGVDIDTHAWLVEALGGQVASRQWTRLVAMWVPSPHDRTQLGKLTGGDMDTLPNPRENPDAVGRCFVSGTPVQARACFVTPAVVRHVTDAACPTPLDPLSLAAWESATTPEDNR
jgi:hypothetical protein